MIKIKPIIISASIAFVLSFFIALIAKSGFPVSLLKAVIFAVVFGGLAAGIQYVYAKFLIEDSASISEGEAPQRPLGSKVDLVVSEEDLPSDGAELTFSFDGERHVLTSEDVGASARNGATVERVPVPEPKPSVAEASPVLASEATDNAKPVSVSEPAQAGPKNDVPETKLSPNIAASMPAASDNASPPSAAKGDFEALPELDNLPDFGGESSASEAGGEGGEVIEDSDFAEEGSVAPARRTEFSDGTVADTKDASLMARAIQTVLAHEE